MIRAQSSQIFLAEAYKNALENTLTDPTWRRFLISEFKSEYMKSVWDFLAKEELKVIKYLFKNPLFRLLRFFLREILF